MVFTPVFIGFRVSRCAHCPTHDDRLPQTNTNARRFRERTCGFSMIFENVAEFMPNIGEMLENQAFSAIPKRPEGIVCVSSLNFSIKRLKRSIQHHNVIRASRRNIAPVEIEFVNLARFRIIFCTHGGDGDPRRSVLIKGRGIFSLRRVVPNC